MPSPLTACGIGASACQVYTAGDKDDFGQPIACFRIPSIVRLGGGLLLAFAEARPLGCRPDIPAGNRIVVRWSADQGTTWSNISTAMLPLEGGALTYPTPALLLNGSVLLLASHFHSATGVFAAMSNDQGRSWSPSRRVPSLENCTLGPGAQPAKLLPATLAVPCIKILPGIGADMLSRTVEAGDEHLSPSPLLLSSPQAFVATSTDWGVTWAAGPSIPSTPNISLFTEPQLVADGRSPRSVLLLARVNTATALTHHAVAGSLDAGLTWGEVQPLPELAGTTCAGALAHTTRDELFVSAPAFPREGLGGRRNLTVWQLCWRRSTRSWFASSPRSAWGAAAGYSAFDASSDRVMMLYEAGNHIYDFGIKLSFLPTSTTLCPPRPPASAPE